MRMVGISTKRSMAAIFTSHLPPHPTIAPPYLLYPAPHSHDIINVDAVTPLPLGLEVF